MNQDEIRIALVKAVEENRVRDLVSELSNMDETELFNGLYPIAIDAQWHGPSVAAAWMLVALEPTCPLTCEEAIRAMLPDWDVSIEEVPFYLTTQFGKQGILKTIQSLREQITSEEAIVVLRTVEHWVKIPSSQLIASWVRSRPRW